MTKNGEIISIEMQTANIGSFKTIQGAIATNNSKKSTSCFSFSKSLIKMSFPPVDVEAAYCCKSVALSFNDCKMTTFMFTFS